MSENLKEVKLILDIADTRLDKYLEFCEKNITAKILERTHTETVSKELNSLIQEFLIEQYNLNKNGVGKGEKEVSSVSDNGQSVNFQTVGGASSMSKTATEFLDKNMDSIIACRKVGW